MARSIDQDKIQSIKNATIELIVQKGYGGASVSAIAKKAEVADGYLYRFYKGKQELVIDLLQSKVQKLFDQLDLSIRSCQSTHTAIEFLIEQLFNIAQKSPIELKFMHVLMHDYNFQISEPQRNTIKLVCQRILIKGQANKEIAENITIEEIFSMMVIYPIEFINLRLKDFFGQSTWSTSDLERVVEFIIKSLK